MKTFEVTGLAIYAPYLINGDDDDGFDADDKAAADRLMAQFADAVGPVVVDVARDRAGEPLEANFAHCPFAGLAGDCVTYVVVDIGYQGDDADPPPSPKVGRLILTAGAIIDADDLEPRLLADLVDCGAQGDASEAVKHVIATWPIEADQEAIRDCLANYGAWEDDELTDSDTNLQRIVWIIGGDFADVGSDQTIFCVE